METAPGMEAIPQTGTELAVAPESMASPGVEVIQKDAEAAPSMETVPEDSGLETFPEVDDAPVVEVIAVAPGLEAVPEE